jgi:hypothetical protein
VEDDEAADRWGWSASGSERARERAAGRWGQFVSEREREHGAAARTREQAGNGPKGGGDAGAREERRPRHGLDSAQLGGVSLFLFIF